MNESDPRKKKLLVVDDDALNRKFLQRMLSPFYLTDSVLNGNQAICAAGAEFPPDLILLDIMMPGMDGLQACKKLKKNESTRNIPVIFVTCRTDDETLQKAFEAGCSDYVRKPTSRVELMARIESVFRQQELMEELLLEEKLKGVLDMAGTICHELNQPMQAVAGYSELLLRDLEKEHPAYVSVSVIKEQIEKMGSITHKLMKITKYKVRDFYRGDADMI